MWPARVVFGSRVPVAAALIRLAHADQRRDDHVLCGATFQRLDRGEQLHLTDVVEGRNSFGTLRTPR